MQKIKLLIALLIILSPRIIWAGTTGKISGQVIDSNTNEPLFGANIVIAGTTLGATTDIDGTYYILNIPPGTYEVKASYIGYQPVSVKGVIVNVDRTTNLDYKLLSTVLETGIVEVIANKNAIIKDLTASSSQIGAEQIEKLPVESISDILSLQVGMTKDGGGGMHLRGGRSSEVEYVVDGISVTNPFGGGLAVSVENNTIQQLEVISGTYNAEYGRAMSGVVNIVTKEGDPTFRGSVMAYTGDFASTHKDMFLNISDVKPFSQKFFEGTFSGPVPFLGNTNFFVSTRLRDEEGWLFGKRLHTPADEGIFESTDPANWQIDYSGDNKIVSMNPSLGRSFQGKLTTSPLEGLKVTYNFMVNYSKWKGYNHSQKYNPDYSPTQEDWGYNNFLSFLNILSPSTFHELRFSYYTYKYNSSVYGSLDDPRYIAGIHPMDLPDAIFSIGTVDPGFSYRKSSTAAAKYDFTSQVHKEHLVKIGAEYRKHKLNDEYIRLRRDEGTNWQLQVDPLTSMAHNMYEKEPVEASAYIQDKIEIRDFIVNAGVRFDYFDANSYVPRDLTDPSNKRGLPFEQAYRKVDVKTQFSPRVGLAFPISDMGSLHASFGQFFQLPEFGRLYENSENEVIGTFESFIGNADLEPQRTTAFEIGLQQQLNDFLVLNVTCYYKDIRNLAGTKLFRTFDQVEYGQYTNVDYGDISGITLALDVLRISNISTSVDYTYQVAKGNGSDPKQAFYDAANKNEATKTLVPLDWDQTHVLNWIFNYIAEDWGVSTITSINSGNPFTTGSVFMSSGNQLINQARRKTRFNMDLRAYKTIMVAGINIELFAKIENVFDQTLSEFFPQLMQKDYESHSKMDYINTLYDIRYNPSAQPRPRLVKLGLSLNIN